MKIICITGYRGSGKTTAIKIMANNLSNSAIIRGNIFLVYSLLKHTKEFEKIFKIPFDKENPYDCIISAGNNDSVDNIERNRQFFKYIFPFIETEIEKAINEQKSRGREFILVEYVSLPIFKIWKQADYRVMIVSNKEQRGIKMCERMITMNESFKEEGWHNLSEKLFEDIIENAENIDFTVENRYNENYEKDLIHLCQKIAKK